MTTIKNGGNIPRTNVTTPTNQVSTPTTTPAAQTPTTQTPADPAAAFSGQAGQADALPSEMPRSGWGDQGALRAAVARAAGALDAEAAPGTVNHRFRETAGDPIPRILPMYGLPMPDELRARPNDEGIAKAFQNMLNGWGTIDGVDAKKLIKAADADGQTNNKLSKTEREDLKRMLDRIPHRMTDEAVQILDDYLKSNAGGLDLQSKAIRDTFKGMMADFRIDSSEASTLLDTVLRDGKISKTERGDLEKIRDNLRLTAMASAKINSALDDGPVNPIDPPIMPMYGVPMPSITVTIKDKTLKGVVDSALADRFIDKADADAIIKSAKDGGGLSKTEREDITRLLSAVGPFIETDAKTKLEQFLGVGPMPVDPPIMPMYGVPMPGPIVVDPPIRPMYGVPMPGPIDTDPVIRPMYGLPVGGITRDPT